MGEEVKREEFYEAVLEAAGKGLCVLVRPGTLEDNVSIEGFTIAEYGRKTITLDKAFSRIESRPRNDRLFTDYVKTCTAKWTPPAATRADLGVALTEAINVAAKRDGRLG